MGTPVLAAAARLTCVLAAENAALMAMDIPAAAALLDEKLAAARGLTQASAARPAMRHADEAGLALQLRDLGQQNRALLEHAIVVQGRVLDMVARAARQGVAQAAGRYGAGGTAALDRGGHDRGAMALHMRA
jgi:flagellar biosynthesis/type III secretory pathway chaperone